jgi:hypothetical protein
VVKLNVCGLSASKGASPESMSESSRGNGGDKGCGQRACRGEAAYWPLKAG